MPADSPALLKIVQVPFCYSPDPVGGTEVYVQALARRLQEKGIAVLVAAPGDRDAAYEHEGIPVRRFGVSKGTGDPRELYGDGDPVAASAFGRLLDEEHPDVLHLHAFTRGASLRLVREAKRRTIAVVFTYHTPTVSCQRGTLLRWGDEVCDGKLDVHGCARCTLHGLGLNRAASVALGSVPPRTGRWLGSLGLAGGPWTALRMAELVELRHGSFRALMAEVDHVVAVCEWAKDLLARNGVPERKITVSRHGLPRGMAADHAEASPRSTAQLPLRTAYLGRLDPTKGPDLFIRALRALPDAPLELDLYGIVQGETGKAYLRHLQALAAGDARIRFRSPVPGAQVVSLLRGYDLLAVPSRWVETGPLVVLEAFAAGVPVIGSRLGGIAELVQHGRDGILVDPFSPGAWQEALRQIARDRDLLLRLRRGVRPPRGVEQVADEMEAIYRSTAQDARAEQAGTGENPRARV